VFTSQTGKNAAATATVTDGAVSAITITNAGEGYQVAPVLSFTGGGGTSAAATCTIETDIDKVESFGDNNAFQEEADDTLFSVDNPFGDAP
jgi:hypothetical protein